MNDRGLPLLPIGILFLLVLLTFWLSRFVQPAGAKADGKSRHDPDLIVERFSAQKLNPTGDVQYQLNAAKMTHYPDDDSSVLDSVLFTAYQPGQPQITARAPTGRLLNGKDVIIMEGNVVLDSAAGPRLPATTMKTPTLTVEPDNSIAYADNGVVISSANSLVEAKHFRLNTLTREISLKSVSGSLAK
jgi:lipopolysaccharide export system protein LptC